MQIFILSNRTSKLNESTRIAHFCSEGLSAIQLASEYQTESLVRICFR